MKRIFRIFSVSLLCFLLGGTALMAQTLPADANLVKGKLKNGFTYYIYKNNKAHGSSVLRLFLNAGSLQEEADQQGLAHFIEHMAFNGTKHYSKNDVITFLESKGVKFGADLNAHTSFDETVYKIAINTENPANLQKAIDIMGDWAFGVTFDQAELDKERGVVIEEWRSKQGAENRLREQYLPVLFSGSRYAERMPIGKVDVLKTFKRQRIVDFYQKWYRPDLMAIAVVTDVDPKIVEGFIKSEFSDYTASSQPTREFYSLPAHKDTLFSIVTDKEARTIELSFYNKVNSFRNIKTEQDYKEMLIRQFYNGLAKRRFARVSQLQNNFKEGSLSVGNMVLKNGVIAGGVSLFHDQVTQGIAAYLTEVQRIVRYGFTADEVNKFRNEYIAVIKRAAAAEDKTQPEAYVNDIHDEFYDGNTMLARAQRYQLLLKYAPQIDADDILKYVRSIQTPGNTVVLLTAPEKYASALPNKNTLRGMFAAAAAQQLNPWQDSLVVPKQLLSQQPVTGQIVKEQQINEIGVTKWVLSNGATVYIKPTTERKDYISLNGFRAGGFFALDSSRFVTAQFVKPVIGLSGAGAFSRRALTEFLAGNTASATLVLSNTREGVVAGADWKDAQTMFQLLYLKWMYPNADESTFSQTKRQAVESLENAKLSPSYEYTKTIGALLKGDDDAMPDLTPERINKELKFNDIVPIFKERFGSAKDFQFIIVGNFNLEELKPLVTQYLGALPGTDYHSKYAYKGPVASAKPQDILMYAGQAPKSTVNLFYQSNNVEHDYPEIVVGTLLQEVLKVKLRLNLREENSGVYGVAVSIGSTNKPSPLIRSRVSFTCAPEAADFLIKQAQAEIAKVAAEPNYFTAELENIKLQELTSYNKQVNKNIFWSSSLRNHFYFGFKDYSYLTNYPQMLKKITPEQISAYAKKYLVSTPGFKAVLMPASNKTNN